MTVLLLLLLLSLAWLWVRGKRRASGAPRVPLAGSGAVPGGRLLRRFSGSGGSM